MEEFGSNLIRAYNSISNQNEFIECINIETQKQKISKDKKVKSKQCKDIHFPALKPKSNLQIQNRLK